MAMRIMANTIKEARYSSRKAAKIVVGLKKRPILYGKSQRTCDKLPFVRWTRDRASRL